VRFYLTYGIVPIFLLLVLLIRTNRRRWDEVLRLSEGNAELSSVVSACRPIARSTFTRGLMHGIWFLALGMACSFFVSADERPALRVMNMYFLPGMIWAIPGSWTGLMLASVRNTLTILGEGVRPHFVAYLRDRQEEQREEMMGPPDTATPSPIQRGIRRLSKSIPEKLIFGFWDPKDRRTGVSFSPLISSEDRWKVNVTRFCERASAIVLDVSTFSPSIAWKRSCSAGALILPARPCC
jgi:hypothetical protein